MADHRPIIFGPGDKLAQLEAVALHPEATSLDSQVSIVVSSRIDKYLGNAVIGQAWIAAAISCAERSVRGSAARMQRLRLWDIKAGGGRGLANTWKPIARKPGTQLPPLSDKPGTQLPGYREQTRQMATRNPANGDTKPGTQLPPLPTKNLNSSFGETVETNPHAAKWQSIKSRLAISLSPELVTSWFDPMELVTITDTELVLRSPTRHARQHVENNYLFDRLSNAVRAGLGPHVRVCLVDPTARAAE